MRYCKSLAGLSNIPNSSQSHERVPHYKENNLAHEDESNWLHRTIDWFQRGLSSLGDSGRVERDEDKGDMYTAVTNAMKDGYDWVEVEESADSGGVMDGDYGDEDAMDFDVLDSP